MRYLPALLVAEIITAENSIPVANFVVEIIAVTILVRDNDFAVGSLSKHNVMGRRTNVTYISTTFRLVIGNFQEI